MSRGPILAQGICSVSDAVEVFGVGGFGLYERTSEPDRCRPRQEAQAPMECGNCNGGGGDGCRSEL